MQRNKLITLSVFLFFFFLLSEARAGFFEDWSGTPTLGGVAMEINPSMGSGDIAVDDDDAVHICYNDDSYDLIYATNASGSWSSTTVDSGSYYGGCSLDIDSDGYAHVVYSSLTEIFYASNESGTWVIETIESVDVMYVSISEHDVKVTSTGDVHVSYYDDTNDDLKYALRADSTSLWTTTTVDSSGDVGLANSLVVVGNSIYIAYTDSTNDDIKLASFDGSTWTLTTVTATYGPTNNFSALADDGNGNLFLAFRDSGHISYDVFEIVSSTWSNEDVTTYYWYGSLGNIDMAVDDFDNIYLVWSLAGSDLVYMATNAMADSSSTWVESVVSDSFLVSYYDTDVAVDSFGKLHILFPDHDKDLLYYYENTDGNHEMISTSNSYSSVATDDNGHVYVAYYDTFNGDALFLSYDSWGGWSSSETIDTGSGSDVGQYISLAVEDDGSEYHVSYYDAGGSDLMYAHKTSSASTWTTETVASSGAVGQYSALFVDSAGYAHISYYDATNGDLKYATNKSGSWTTATVDGVGDVGKYTTSIALSESTGRLHICYLDDTNSRLKYAYKDTGSAWVRANVDTAVRGLYCDITATSTSNIAYISYYDPSADDLKYARVSASSGVVSVAAQTVDSTGDVGAYTSIALDSMGRRHITYYDATNDDLKYARMDTLGSWDIKTLGDAVGIGTYTSLAFDAHGHAQILSVDSASNQLYHTYY